MEVPAGAVEERWERIGITKAVSIEQRSLLEATRRLQSRKRTNIGLGEVECKR